MSSLIIDEEARCKKGQRLAKQLREVSRRNLSNLPAERLTKKHLHTIQEAFLDCYGIYIKMQEELPVPRVIDESGTIVDQLEKYEQRLQHYLNSKDDQIVRWTRAWLDLLQKFRWLIMINDGLSDIEQTDGPLFQSGRDLVASLDYE